MDKYWLLVIGLVGGVIVRELGKKMWEDLIPKTRIFTWPRMLALVLVAVTLGSLYTFAKVISYGDPIIAMMSKLFLTNVAITAWVALAGGIYLWRQHRRVEAIERHVGSITRQ